MYLLLHKVQLPRFFPESLNFICSTLPSPSCPIICARDSTTVPVGAALNLFFNQNIILQTGLHKGKKSDLEQFDWRLEWNLGATYSVQKYFWIMIDLAGAESYGVVFVWENQ